MCAGVCMPCVFDRCSRTEAGGWWWFLTFPWAGWWIGEWWVLWGVGGRRWHVCASQGRNYSVTRKLIICAPWAHVQYSTFQLLHYTEKKKTPALPAAWTNRKHYFTNKTGFMRLQAFFITLSASYIFKVPDRLENLTSCTQSLHYTDWNLLYYSRIQCWMCFSHLLPPLSPKYLSVYSWLQITPGCQTQTTHTCWSA